MFSLAVKKAGRFTKPLLTIRRHFDRTTDCGCGAFVILNEDGWIATAAHLFRSFDDFRQHARELEYYFARMNSATTEGTPGSASRRKRVFGLRTNPKWITSHAFWWGRENVRLEDVAVYPEADLAVGRLVPFEPGPGAACAVLKNPANLDVGESLCKLGYPFNRIDAVFDETDGSVALAPGVVPLTLFPIEGIYTRTLSAGRSRDGTFDVKFLETSSPGLVGQSGGPVFDKDGTVWAIQSRTDIHPMCAAVTDRRSGRTVREKHFLEVGVGVHPEVIVSVLSGLGIRFALSDN